MGTFITVVHITACILLTLVVLIQSGKGAEISATLGGSSQTIFGSSGGANFFTRFTSATAVVFMVTSLSLTYISGQARKSLFEATTAPITKSAAPVQSAAPVAPAMPAAPSANPVTPPSANK